MTEETRTQSPAIAKGEKLAAKLLEQLKAMLPERASLHEPKFGSLEEEYTAECLKTGWVSTAGRFVDLFERKIEAFTGAPHAIAVVNGTSALHAALEMAGVCAGEGVFLPALTFVATANAVSYCGAEGYFVDAQASTLGMDPEKLEKEIREHCIMRDGVLIHAKSGKQMRAVVAVHVLGHPAQCDRLAEICSEHGLVLIEDACESLGSYYKGKHTGRKGLISVLSFNGNKTITTGGGGMILTEDPVLAAKLKHMTTTAKIPHAWRYEHDITGYNYRMPNINAAIGCAQMESLEINLKKKRQIYEKYKEALHAVEGLRLMSEPQNAQSNYWMNAVLLNEPDEFLRDCILEELNGAGLMCRPLWTPLNRMPMFGKWLKGELTVTEDLFLKTVCLPSSPFLADRWQGDEEKKEAGLK